MFELFSLSNLNNFSVHLLKASQFINQGGVIAVPTDTVYGLAADAQNEQAIQQLYAIKGRQTSKPIAICVDRVNSISRWGKTDFLPEGLLDTLLPGPVTIVLERTPELNPLLNPGIHNVGVRVPDHEFVRNLCQEINSPLALTSANATNEQSSLSPDEFKHLWPHLKAVFHSGRIGDSPELRLGSTVVDLTTPGKYRTLRPGSALANTEIILKQFGLQSVPVNNIC